MFINCLNLKSCRCISSKQTDTEMNQDIKSQEENPGESRSRWAQFFQDCSNRSSASAAVFYWKVVREANIAPRNFEVKGKMS